jgi:hypothetical protein
MVRFRGLLAVARRLSTRRLIRVVLALAVFAAVSAWWFLYRPREAHYRGLPSSYWASLLAHPSCNGRPAWVDEIIPDKVIDAMPLWLERYLEIPAYDERNSDFTRVLVELLNHRDAEVRLRAADLLSDTGEMGVRQALAIWTDTCEQDPNVDHRLHALRSIASNVDADREAVTAAFPTLLNCHERETDQYVRNGIVETLRAIDPASKQLPPLIYEFHCDAPGFVGPNYSEKVPLPRNLFEQVGATGWASTMDATAPAGHGFVLTRTEGAEQSWTPLNVPLALTPFNVALAGYRNIELRVSIKAIGGKTEQGGGLLWRDRGKGNYYAASMNPLDGSLRLYKFVDGKRTQLECRVGLKATVGEWHELSVKHAGDRIECFIDGQKYLDVSNDSIKAPGSYGLWANGDARTCFDKLRVTDFGD